MLPIPLQPPSQSGTGDRSRPDYHREPFRLFFPLAVLIGWIGVGHWLLYALGVTSSFSGFMHGQLMMQAFMMAFALGFLLTAVPRRTQAPPPSTVEIGAARSCWPSWSPSSATTRAEAPTGMRRDRLRAPPWCGVCNT
jgi:hypothetical protein